MPGRSEADEPGGEIPGNPAQAGDLRQGFVKAGFGLDLGQTSNLDAKTAALLQVAVSAAIGSSPVCLQWSTSRALAAGATKEEIADVLPAIIPVAGLSRIVTAAPEVATALEYDIEAALEEPNDC